MHPPKETQKVADHSKILDNIAKSTDASQLRRIRDNAKRLRETAVDDAAFRRLVEILAQHEPGSIEHDFWKTIHAFEELLRDARGKTVRLSRTRQKVSKVGIKRTLIDFAMNKAPTSGFEMLIEMDHADLTGEALILKHGLSFDSEVRAAARKRLENAGVNIGTLRTSM